MTIIIEKYLKMLNERRQSVSSVSSDTIMYHGSKVQNLKVIDPKEWVDALRKAHIATTWASWDKTFASMFCIDWRKDIEHIFIGTDISFYVSLPRQDERGCLGGVTPLNSDRCNDAVKNPKWMVVVPKRYKNLLTQACSLYEIQTDKWIIPKRTHDYNWNFPEAYTKQPAEVIKEIKYNTVLEAYKKNGVKLLVENNFSNSTKWQRIFSKMKI